MNFAPDYIYFIFVSTKTRERNHFVLSLLMNRSSRGSKSLSESHHLGTN